MFLHLTECSGVLGAARSVQEFPGLPATGECWAWGKSRHPCMQHWCEMWMYSRLKATGKNVGRTWWFLRVSWKEFCLCSSSTGGLGIRRLYSQAWCVGQTALLAGCRGIRNMTVCKKESNLPVISKDSLLLSIRNHVLVPKELWFEKRTMSKYLWAVLSMRSS